MKLIIIIIIIIIIETIINSQFPDLKKKRAILEVRIHFFHQSS